MNFDADEFMRGYEWAKWSDCREMVEDAYCAGFNAAKEMGKARAALLDALKAAEIGLANAKSYAAIPSAESESVNRALSMVRAALG